MKLTKKRMSLLLNNSCGTKSGLQLTTWRYQLWFLTISNHSDLEKALLKVAQCTINHATGYAREFVFNPETIDENVRKILYEFDIKEIPLNENQEGYWRDLIDSFWRIPTSPDSPDITTWSNSPLPDWMPTPSTPELAEVSIIASSSLETPPVSLCFVTKKNLISTSKTQLKTLFLLFLRSSSVQYYFVSIVCSVLYSLTFLSIFRLKTHSSTWRWTFAFTALLI